MEKCSMFLCKLCGKYFSTISNLARHVDNDHKKDLQSRSRYSCKLCEKDFSTSSNLLKHLESIHKKDAHSKTRHICKKCGKVYATKSYLCTHEKHCVKKKSNYLKCPLCNVEAELIDLYSHFLDNHGIKVESEKLYFESFLDFEKWKHEIEKNTVSKYIISTDSKQVSGQKTCYYRCHRTGFTKPATDNFCRTKRLGSNKIDGYCPAKLQVVREQGGTKITVSYVKTHIGHNMELERIPLSKQDRPNIAEKIQNNVPFDEIITLAKDSKSESVDQMHILTKKDLYNIKQALKTNNGLNKDSKQTFSEEKSKQLQVQPAKDNAKLHNVSHNVVNQCQIQDNIPFDKIISSAKDNKTDNVNRIHLLTEKDLYDIKQALNTSNRLNKDSKQNFGEDKSKQLQVQPTKDSVKLHNVLKQCQIQEVVPSNKIIGSVKDSNTDSGRQMHLLIEKDLYNAKQALITNIRPNRDSLQTLGEEYSKQLQVQTLKDSVKSHIHHLSDSDIIKNRQDENSECAVRFFKNHAEINKKYPELRLNDYLLIVMNKVQLDFLMEYGNHCLCIDTTHGEIGQYFKLTTLIVLNSEGQGLPCLFAVSNRTETIVYKIIFDVLKHCLNGKALTPKVLVTDMTGNFYLAWLNIMGPVKFRLYCTWHVEKAWRENLIPKIENKESQEYVYKCLRTLLEEQDRAAFERMMKNFLMDLETSHEFKEFLVDFRTSFFGCRQSWAACYRKNAEVDWAAMEKIHFEIHEALGTIYLKDKDVKQQDRVVDLLLRHVNVRSLNKEQQTHKHVDIIHRHKSMLSTQKNFIVINETADKWFVPCVNLNKIFTVQTSTANCNCNVKCHDCDACIHAYVCSCPDSSINGNMCKHIHLVCASLAQERMEVQGKKCGSSCIDDDSSSYSEELGVSGEAKPEPPLSYLKNKLQNTFNRILRRVDGTESYDIVRNALIGAFDDINSIIK